MVIEQFDTEGAQQAYLICKQSHPVPWSFNVFADCLDTPYFGFQLYDGGETVGYYIALKVLDELTLMDIAISPAHRNKGYGGKLLSHFLSQANDLGVTKCWLEVRTSNDTAINMYTQFGFKAVEIRKNYYQNIKDANGIKTREDGLVMQCIV